MGRGIGGPNVHLHQGVLGVEACERLREKLHGHAVQGQDGRGSGDPPVPCINFASHPSKVLESAPAVSEHDLARLGEVHPASTPFEHGFANQFRQIEDLAVDCGRGDVKASRRLADGAASGYGREVPENWCVLERRSSAVSVFWSPTMGRASSRGRFADTSTATTPRSASGRTDFAFDGRLPVLRNAGPVLVHDPEIVLRRRVPLPGGQGEPFVDLLEIPGAPFPMAYRAPESFCALSAPCSAAVALVELLRERVNAGPDRCGYHRIEVWTMMAASGRGVPTSSVRVPSSVKRKAGATFHRPPRPPRPVTVAGELESCVGRHDPPAER